MLHFSKSLHVLALGLWFGTAIFFSFVVGLNLFGTFESVAGKEPEEREVWFPMWKVYDRKALDNPSFAPAFVESVRKEQGTRAAGAAIRPLFYWYFGIQSVCALLAAATALSWRRMSAGRVHSVRIRVLLTALATVALGCWLLRVVEDKLDVRNQSFDAMVRHLPQRAEVTSAFVKDLSAFLTARQEFGLWHLVSLGVNMVTVVLVTIAMAQAAYLPVVAPEEKKIV
jgi:glycerol-3-phosphate acyltransferase PlsY